MKSLDSQDLPPVMHQRWEHLCFLHFPLQKESLAELVPAELEIDEFSGSTGVLSAWLGIVAFTMNGIQYVDAPKIPGHSAFHETNLRTYVTHPKLGRGVWFFSLDATNRVACEVARWAFGLNYLYSEIRLIHEGNSVDYRVRRLDEPQAEMTLAYEIGDEIPLPCPGSFEHWAAERYRLFSLRNGELCTATVAHAPYPLRQAKVRKLKSNIASSHGFVESSLAHAMYSPGVDVLVHPLVSVAAL